MYHDDGYNNNYAANDLRGFSCQRSVSQGLQMQLTGKVSNCKPIRRNAATSHHNVLARRFMMTIITRRRQAKQAAKWKKTWQTLSRSFSTCVHILHGISLAIAFRRRQPIGQRGCSSASKSLLNLHWLAQLANANKLYFAPLKIYKKCAVPR